MPRLCRHASGRKAGLYFVDYHTVTPEGKRKRRRESLGTTDEATAQAAYGEWERDVYPALLEQARKAKAVSISTDPTLESLCRWYVEELQAARGNAEITRHDNRRIFKAFTDFCHGSGVKRFSELLLRNNVIDAYAAKLLAEYKPTTARNHLTKIRAVFANAAKRGMIPREPIADWPMPKRRRAAPDETITPAQFSAILKALEGHRLYNAIVFMAYVGCRPSDVCGLTWARVRLHERAAAITQKKTQDPVYAPLAEPAVRALEAERERGVFGPYVFTDTHGKQLRRNQIQNTLLWYGTTRGIGHITPKSFREFVVTDLLDAGADGQTVGMITGHRSQAMESYARRKSARARAAIEQFAERHGGVPAPNVAPTAPIPFKSLPRKR